MSQQAYANEWDIANRALGHLGAPPVYSPTENSKNARIMSQLYHKVRQYEMRRNVWRFATRRVALRAMTPTTMKFTPETWQQYNVYVQGSIVNYNGVNYISTTAENVNNIPGQVDGAWENYFGPLTADAWNSGTTYWMGELVYMAVPAPGGISGQDANSQAGLTGLVVFSSRYANNADTPNAPFTYVATQSYNQDDVVSDGSGNMWRSLIPANLGNALSAAPAVWNSGTAYSTGNTVTGGDGYVYKAVQGNTNVEPVNDAANNTETNWTPATVAPFINAWTQIPGNWQADYQWAVQNGTLTSMISLWPVGTGPITDTSTRNAYYLPSGYLREAPQDPKAGITTYLGSPTGLTYSDWLFEGDYITTYMSQLIIFRFCADITQVSKFDPMFCEGFALGLAIDACEEITQSADKMNRLMGLYNKRMSEARIVNGIEASADAPPEDDYVTTRL